MLLNILYCLSVVAMAAATVWAMTREARYGDPATDSDRARLLQLVHDDYSAQYIKQVLQNHRLQRSECLAAEEHLRERDAQRAVGQFMTEA